MDDDEADPEVANGSYLFQDEWVHDLDHLMIGMKMRLVHDKVFPMDYRKNAYRLEMNVNHAFFKNECDLWLSQTDDETVTAYVFQARKLVKRVDCSSTEECFSAVQTLLKANIHTYRSGEQALSDRHQFHALFVFKFNALQNRLMAKNNSLRWTDRLVIGGQPLRGTAIVEFDPDVYKKHPNTVIFVVFNPIHMVYWAKIGVQVEHEEYELHLEEMHTLEASVLKIYEILLDRNLQHLTHKHTIVPGHQPARRRRVLRLDNFA